MWKRQNLSFILQCLLHFENTFYCSYFTFPEHSEELLSLRLGLLPTLEIWIGIFKKQIITESTLDTREAFCGREANRARLSKRQLDKKFFDRLELEWINELETAWKTGFTVSFVSTLVSAEGIRNFLFILTIWKDVVFLQL